MKTITAQISLVGLRLGRRNYFVGLKVIALEFQYIIWPLVCIYL